VTATPTQLDPRATAYQLRSFTDGTATVDGHRIEANQAATPEEAAVGWVAARAREQGGPVRVTATDPTGDAVALVVHPDGRSELDPDATGYLDEADPDPAGVHHAPPVRPVEVPTASRFPTPPPARSAVPEPAAGPAWFPAGPPPAAGSVLAATTPAARGGGRRRSRRTGAPISSAAPIEAAALPAAPLHLSAEQLLPRYSTDRIAPASWGWQGLIRRVTTGTIQPRPGAAELTHRGYVRSVQRRLPGPRTIVVVNPKGGAGKTPAALLTAATFGCHRGSALAWDNNETRGTLALRGLEDLGGRTVWDLLADLDRFEDPRARIGDLAAYLHPQGDARFDILASDARPDRMVEVDGAAFDRLRAVLTRFYTVLIVDTGNNVRASNWQAAIDAADQLLVVSSFQRDSAVTASWVLDHLQATGRSDLVAAAVTIVSHATPTTDRRTAAEITDHFAARTRAIIQIPYDPGISAGEHLDLLTLRHSTRAAWLAVAGALSAGLGQSGRATDDLGWAAPDINTTTTN
jgi:MinD-like ATPase involved in chromosome partitioning or flagellar assembly